MFETLFSKVFFTLSIQLIITFFTTYEGIPVEVYHDDEVQLIKDLLNAKEEYFATLEKERKEKERKEKERYVSKDVIAFSWNIKEENKFFDEEVAKFLQEELGMEIQWETQYYSQEHGYKNEYHKECLFARTFFSTKIIKYINGAIDQRKVRSLLEGSKYAETIKKFLGVIFY